MPSTAMASYASPTGGSHRRLHLYCTLLNQIQFLIATMRRNYRWKTSMQANDSSYVEGSPHSLINALEDLRYALPYNSCADDSNDSASAALQLPVTEILQPLLRLITSSDTNGDITAASINAVRIILDAGLLASRSSIEEQRQTSHAIAAACYSCQYESTDTSTDELVLVELMKLQLTLLHVTDSSSDGQQQVLAEDDIWNILTTSWHVHLRMRPPQYSPLLVLEAERTITEIVANVCKRTSAIESQADDTAAAQSTATRPHLLCRVLELICGIAETTHSSTYTINADLTSMSNDAMNSTAPTSAVYFAPFSFFTRSNHEQRHVTVSEFHDLGLFNLSPLDSIADGASSTSPNTTLRLLHDWIQRSLLTCKLIETVLDNIDTNILLHNTHARSYFTNHLCKFLLRGASSTHSTIVSYCLSLFFRLVVTMRQHMTMQIETFINTVHLRILSPKQTSHSTQTSSHSSSEVMYNESNLVVDPSMTLYELRELMLESLLDFCHQPWFWCELYVNYDCQPTASDLFDHLFSTLCKTALTMNGLMTGNHVLALRCLLEGVKAMEARGQAANANATTDTVTAPTPTTAAELHQRLRELRSWKRAFTTSAEQFSSKPRKALQLMHETLQLFPTLAALEASIAASSTAHTTSGMATLQQQIAGDQRIQQEIRQFAWLLRYIPVLDKISIGQLIAEPSALHAAIRREYVKHYDFTGLNIDSAMRIYLEGFRLPLEAQQIDRVLQEFAHHYHEQNSDQLSSSDTVHTLCFSLLMLNTDQHNSQVRNKMTLQQFISNNRGINDGKDVNAALLTELYYNIRKNEIKMSGDGVTGRVNDALWCDLHRISRQPQQLHHSATYIYLCNDPAALSSTMHLVNARWQQLPQPPKPLILRSASYVHYPPINRSVDGDAGTDAVSTFDNELFHHCCSPVLAALTIMFESNDISGARSSVSVPLDGSAGVVSPAATADRHINIKSIAAMTQSHQSLNNVAPRVAAPPNADNNISKPALKQKTTRPTTSQLLFSGFQLIADVCALHNYSAGIDRLIGSLARFTTLTNELDVTGQPRQQQQLVIDLAVQKFGANVKALAAFATLFEVVHAHAAHVRDGWKDIVQIIHQLDTMQLLPNELLRLEDMTQQSLNQPEGNEAANVDADVAADARKYSRANLLTHIPSTSQTTSPIHRSQSSSSWFSSFFLTPAVIENNKQASRSDADQHDARSDEETRAHRRGTKYIKSAKLSELLDDTKLSDESVLSLVEGLIESCSLRAIAASDADRALSLKNSMSHSGGIDDTKSLLRLHHMDIPLELRKLLLNLHLITHLTIQHPHAVPLIWSPVRLYLAAILSSSSTVSSNASSQGLTRPSSRSSTLSTMNGVGDAGTLAHDKSQLLPDPTTLNQALTALSLTTASQSSTPTPSKEVNGLNGSHVQPATLGTMPNLAIEAAIATLFQLLTSTALADTQTEQVVELLNYIAGIDLRYKSIAQQVAHGLASLALSPSLQTSDTAVWQAVFVLYARLSDSEYAYDIAHTSLCQLLQQVPVSRTTTLTRTRLILDVIIAYSKSRYCQAAHSSQHVGLLRAMAATVTSLLSQLAQSSGDPHGNLDWQFRAFLRPLLVSFRAMSLIATKRLQSQSVDISSDEQSTTWQKVRLQSVRQLGEILGAGELHRASVAAAAASTIHTVNPVALVHSKADPSTHASNRLDTTLRQLIMEEIVIPLVTELREQCELAISTELSHAQAHSLAMLSAAYIRQLNATTQASSSDGSADVHTTWFTVLRQFDRSLTIATRHQQALAKANKSTEPATIILDTAQSSLTQMLQLMGKHGMFDADNGSKPAVVTNLNGAKTAVSETRGSGDSGSVELWELTSSIVSPFYPELLHQLFPSLYPQQVLTPKHNGVAPEHLGGADAGPLLSHTTSISDSRMDTKEAHTADQATTESSDINLSPPAS